MAGQYVDTLAPDAPPINLAGLTPQHDAFGNAYYANQQSLPLSFLFPQAHAQGGLLDFGWGFINFFLPIEDIGIVLQQMAYAVSDPDKFEPDEFIISLINVVTIFPPAKPLKLITVPLRSLFRALKVVNPKFVEHFGGMFSGVMNKAKKGDFDALWHLLPFFVIAVEMYNDPEARKGLEFMFSTVDSGEDVLSWVDYLALPAGGWDGEGEIPEVDAFAMNTSSPSQLPLSFMMNQAHAQRASVARVSGQIFGNMLAKVSKMVTKGEAKDLPDALKIIRQQMREEGVKDLAKHLFSPSTFKASVTVMARGGQRSLVNFVRGKHNARYSTPMILATMGYLGWEMTCGALLDNDDEAAPTPEGDVTADDLGCGDKGLNAQVSAQIAKKFAIAFADTADRKLTEQSSVENDQNPGLNRVDRAGHGALFHLVQTASFQLQHRFAGGLRIKGLEKARWVGLFDDIERIPNNGVTLACGKTGKGCYMKKLRYVDIVLGSSDEPETWVELKSWAAQSATGQGRYKLVEEKIRGNFAGWNFDETLSGNTTLHRQFSLDRAAKNLSYAWLTKREGGQNEINVRQEVGSIKWLFQAFKEFDKSRGNSTQPSAVSPLLGGSSKKDSLRWLITTPPEGGDTPKLKEIRRTSFGTDTGVGGYMQLATPQILITNFAKTIFNDVKAGDEPDIDID